MTPKQFIEALHQLGYLISDTQISQFDKYRSFLQQENQKINLTALISNEDIYEKHFYDCSLILPLLDNIRSFCDVGSGAGFPGVVIAIVRPDIQVTLLEPTLKRCRFLEALAQELDLRNITVVNQRAEEFTEGFEQFDGVSARAVAQLPILLEICLPLLKVGGLMIAMKGSQGESEAQLASNALKVLKASIEQIQSETLLDSSKRVNLCVRKQQATPKKYPRAYAQIKKNPL